MDFDRLPDNAFEKIFQYLPFQDRVRIARVRKCFFRWSEIFIIKTKSINLGENRKMTPPALERLLNSCSNNLRSIKFIFTDYRNEMIEVFAKFSCPALEEIDLGLTRIDHYTFGTLIMNNPNLKVLIRGDESNEIEYPAFLSDKLEVLKVGCCKNNSFISLTGRCPNLKHFEIGTALEVRRVAFDDFFASCPLVQTIVIKELKNSDVDFSNLVHFWQLEFLHTLVIANDSLMHDDSMTKISTSFPRLEVLKLNRLYVSDKGVRALTVLENLRVLWLEGNIYQNYFDEGVPELAKCGRLEDVRLGYRIAPNTFTAFIRHCHDLRVLHLDYGVESKASQLRDAFKSLSGLEGKKRQLAIKVDKSHCYGWYAICNDALRQLSKQGHKITFEHSVL